MRNGLASSEARRLHSFYCAGCGEYGGHKRLDCLDFKDGSCPKNDGTGLWCENCITTYGDPWDSVGASGTPESGLSGSELPSGERDAGFDSPPPPSHSEHWKQPGCPDCEPHVHDADCYDC